MFISSSKPMKKFVFKFICFICIVAAICLGLNALYVAYDKSDDDFTRKFKNVPENIEICNLGSSHGLYGYCYEDYEDEYTCFNFSLVAQSLTYDYNVLSYYKDHLKKGAYVFVNLSYFVILGEDETNNDDFESQNKRYYKFLPPSLVKEYSPYTDLIVSFPILEAGGINVIAPFIGACPEDLHGEWYVTADTVDVEDDAKKAALRHTVENKRDADGNLIINQNEIQAIYDIIDLCEEEGFQCVLIMPPYMQQYVDAVEKEAPGFEAEFLEMVQNISNDTGVPYYDYTTDERLNQNYGYFMNSDHLNYYGAKAFTEILMQEIVKE